MKYTVNFTVNSHDTDLNGILRPSALLKYLQEAANLQMHTYGPDMRSLVSEQNKTFVVSRLSVNVYADLFAWDEIEVTTWANPSPGAAFRRSTQARRDGVIVAEMISVFALIDLQTGRLCRTSDVQFGFDTDDSVLDIDEPESFRIPADVEAALRGEHTVRYADVDYNMHMNNTVYPDVLCGFLPDIEKKRILSFALHYMHEAKHGQTFKVYVGSDEDVSYLRTQLPGGSCGVEAIFMTEDLSS